jgi:hypothetical protein
MDCVCSEAPDDDSVFIMLAGCARRSKTLKYETALP